MNIWEGTYKNFNHKFRIPYTLNLLFVRKKNIDKIVTIINKYK